MLEDLSLFAMAQRSVNYLARREAVLSENVANANTPNFKSKDLAPVNFQDLLTPQADPVRAIVTNPAHISPEVEATRFETVTEHHPEESKPNGNEVQIEDQLQKIGNTKGKYALAINIMMKNIAMFKIAIDKSE